MRILLSCLQGRPLQALPAYAFWRRYFVQGLREAGHEVLEVPSADWAEGLTCACGAELNTAIGLWNGLPACTGVNQVPCHAGAVLGHVDPNLHFGDDFNSLDLRVTKSWTLFGEQKFQFIGEVFNLFNIANIRGFNNNNYSGFLNDITSPEFNKPLRTAGGFFGSGGPRAFQFALRYAF